MAPSTSSGVLKNLDSSTKFLRCFRRPNNRGFAQKANAPRLSRKRDLFLAFIMVSLPLLIISLALLAFVFLATHERPDKYTALPELPLSGHPPFNAFYTSVSTGPFLLIASWASNVAEIVVAPFMVLFSYAVARESLHQSLKDPENFAARPSLLREIMRGTHAAIWRWIGQRTRKGDEHARRLHVMDVAGLGLFTATLLTVLVVIGDNWLHATTHATQITHYDPPQPISASEKANETLGAYAGFVLNDACNKTISATLPQNISSAPLPCSLNNTDGLDNVAYPEYAYLTLGTGISQLASNFNGLNFSSLANGETKGTETSFQVVTHVDDAGLVHSFLFFTDAAMEYDLSDYEGGGPNFGIDFVANTVSMTTQCTFVTKECDLHYINTSSINNISIPYNCNDDFSGNLGQTPSTGHERAQGWNMSFQEPLDGTPRNIPVQGQYNPFHFYVAAAVNTIDRSDTQDPTSGISETLPDDSSLVDGGHGFTAFALSCEATVHDVTFSLVNGSFHEFRTAKSSPAKASIIKAPLQVGFGQYHLFQAASLAVLATNDSVANLMARSFSQTGMALASGVFDLDSAVQQRYRWTMRVTKVPKAPFFYLVTVCLLYSVFGIVMTVVALHLRRKPEVRDHQARLMVEWGPELLEQDRKRCDEEEGGREGSVGRGDSLE